MALLAGEIAPTSGTIACLSATTLTQCTELFDDTIRGNLLLADPLASDEQLRHVLQAANLLADIHALPKGLSARLGEGGIGLSGGQSRRLALARLFLRDTPLWLLDEPTEGLDGETARAVLRKSPPKPPAAASSSLRISAVKPRSPIVSRCSNMAALQRRRSAANKNSMPSWTGCDRTEAAN